MTEKSSNVQPSPLLIKILHRKLRDSSLVSSFERHRARPLTEGLVRPRWVLLKQHDDDNGGEGKDVAAATDDDSVTPGAKKATGATNNAAGDVSMACNDNGNGAGITNCISGGDAILDGADGSDTTITAVTNNNETSTGKNNNKGTTTMKIKYNTLPQRNYIDLRMEQNKMFADTQCLQCQTILSKLLCASSQEDDGKWKKQADTIQSLLNEGLAACPTHEGLLRAEIEYKGWIQLRIHSLTLTTNGGDEGVTPRSAVSASSGNNPTNTTLQLPKTPSHYIPKKGAEGRAQAAMRDAILERSFLLDGKEEDADGGKREEGVNKYPLLEEANNNEEEEQEQKRQLENGHGGNSSSSSSSSSMAKDRRRRRRKSKHHRRHKKHKRNRKSDDRRRRSSSRRSRSESRSIAPSRSRSGSISSSSYQRRKEDHKERKSRRKHHRRTSHRRSRSSKRNHNEKKESDRDDDNNNDCSGEEENGADLKSRSSKRNHHEKKGGDDGDDNNNNDYSGGINAME
mmetsp:Transcript_6551/g.11646  ORF Transcript_6551/g.11646 Transcript_6551/m.11646 type:complete len:513 (-) Transcript_6551:514-2052(-)